MFNKVKLVNQDILCQEINVLLIQHVPQDQFGTEMNVKLQVELIVLLDQLGTEMLANHNKFTVLQELFGIVLDVLVI